MYACVTFLQLPSTKIVKDQIKRGRKTGRKKPREKKLTYDYIRRISTNINIRWHLSLQKLTIDSYSFFLSYLYSNLGYYTTNTLRKRHFISLLRKKKVLFASFLETMSKHNKKKCRILKYNCLYTQNHDFPPTIMH